MTASQVVGVVGLGYVGLPLAVAFGQHYRTIGYDHSLEKLEQCHAGIDPTGELAPGDLAAARFLEFSAEAARLAAADVVVIAVPTPIDIARRPDFGPLLGACASVGPHLKPGAIVVFESTVYPGATEEVCVPALEAASGKRWKEGFQVAYSPERINPGDRKHTLTSIIKLVSGDTPETLATVSALYSKVVHAGVHPTSSIRVAEAAKVIENTQRDLNIALMNELAILFDRMGLDTLEVLEAAGTKWNFLPFRPGLVGGHCIGVDPYYLTYKAEMLGHHPDVILAGRRINDGMGKFIAEKTVKEMIAAGISLPGARIVVLGLTFKENCADLRNSRVVDIIRELKEYGVQICVHDPLAQPEEAQGEYGVQLTPWEELPRHDALVLAVAHATYTEMPLTELTRRLLPGGCLIDVKSCLPRQRAELDHFRLWRL